MGVYDKIGDKLTKAVIRKSANKIAEESFRGLSEWSVKKAEEFREENVWQERKNVPCKFQDGISYEEFCSIANDVANKMERIINVEVINLMIYCDVESITGKTNWSFSVDFNEWGHLTGGFWKYSENMDSEIPEAYGMEVSGRVNALLRSRNISFIDYTEVIKCDKEAGNLYEFNKRAKKSWIAKVFKRKLIVSNNTENLIGEHLFVTLALLKRDGFTNIKIFPIEDLKTNRDKYHYEVEQVVIDGNSYIKKGEYLSTNAEVLVSYHVSEIDKETRKELRKAKSKLILRKHLKELVLIVIILLMILFSYVGFKYYQKLIPVTFTSDSVVTEDYTEVEEKLKKAGFTNIIIQPIQELDINEIDKENLVSSIVINNDDYFKETSKYPYDSKIVINYYSAKMANLPLARKDAKGMDYREVVEQYEKAGFGKIVLKPKNDLRVGFLHSDGEVSTIKIDGEENYDESEVYRIDTSVEIIYHTYKK